MSQQYINQDMPMLNGLPANWCGTTPSMVPPPPQKNFNPHVNNGLGSSHSSRDSSPGTRNANIQRGNIPASQLPPGRPGISPIPYNLGQNSSNGHTSASVSQLSDNTPHSSPKIQNFSTSTPNPPPVNAPQLNSSAAMVANTNDGCVNNVQNADITVNKSQNLVNQPSSSNPQNVPNLMNVRTNLSKPSTGQNLLVGQQQQSLIHSSSTPSLQNLQGVSALRQELNQPQTVPRPLSSGPQLQQTSQNEQFAKTQNMPGQQQQQPPPPLISNQSYNFNTAPLQRPQPTSVTANQIQPPKPINQLQSQNQPLLNQGQQPPSQMQQLPNQMQQPVNQMQQLPNQVQQPQNQIQQPKPLNQFQQPNQVQQSPHQMQQPKPLNQYQPSNQLQSQNQPPNPMQQPSNLMHQPAKQMQQPSNPMQQPSNPMQQPSNPMQQPPNSMQQPSNPMQQPPNQMQQPPKPMQQPSNPMQQPLNPMQQSPKLMQQPPNLMQQLPNQMPQPKPLNQFQNPNQFQQPPNPNQPLNQMRPPPVQQQSGIPQKVPTTYGANMPPPAANNPPPVVNNPPLLANIPSSASYPTTPVSNLHSKRYPQPPTQIPPQNTYTQNTNISQPNSNLPPAINNYNQQQTMYNQNQPQTQQSYNQQQFGGTNYQQTNLNQQRNYQQMNQQMQNLNVSKSGFNKLWGHENYDLLQCPNVLPEEAVEPPKVSLGQEFLDAANCSHEIFRCTMTKIPENNSLLQKSRLPLGVLIHPFKDLNHLPVIQCNTIVRCRACRTYINPFIFFVDTKRWKCNLCYRVNELPEEFQYDPVSKSYGDPSRRPEIKSSTIEYIAPSEYMLRPPQPAVYLFLLDISRLAVESGYLHTICDALSSQLATLPGDARTQIGFIAYNTTLHFFSLAEGLNQPHEMIVTDVDDIFLPCPDNLLVNLKEHMDLVTDLLAQLPTRYQNSFDTGSALGAALQAAFKMMSSTGGRVTVFQVSLPMVGPGALTVREDPNQRAGKEAPHLNPATDFYKRLALDCSGHQVAVDLFILNSQYVDIATLSGISRFSGGCMHHFPLFKASKTIQAESLDRCFKRYLNRKIGFEAVMRIRCTRGLSIHTFHGNFFVRSTDLLSLPNVNPDAGFGMQVSIEESLSDLQSVCFQAALLYTSSKGERRIRVHTLCLPVVNSLSDILNSADQQCIVGILSKMAADRSLQSSLSDARDAFINVAIDILSSYKLSLNMGNSASGLLAPQSLKLLPLYILALLKYTAFRTGQSTRLDDRVFAMCDMKTLPLAQLIQNVYPDLYPVYRLGECPSVVDAEGAIIPQPRRLQLTARNIDSHGAYILDAGQQMIIYVCPNVSQQFLVHSLGVPNYNSIPDPCYELQTIDNPDNQRLHAFINSLNDEKPYPAALHIIRDNSTSRSLLLERLIEDRIESALSYNEFLQHLKTQVK